MAEKYFDAIVIANMINKNMIFLSSILHRFLCVNNSQIGSIINKINISKTFATYN